MKDTNPSYGKGHVSQHCLTEVSGTSKKAVIYFNAQVLNRKYCFYTLSSRHKACCFNETFGAGSEVHFALDASLFTLDSCPSPLSKRAIFVFVKCP